MKKIFFLLFLSLLAVATFAQRMNGDNSLNRLKGMSIRPAEKMMSAKGTTHYRLEGFTSSDGELITTFHYASGRLIAVLEEVYGDDGYRLYDSIRYNSDGQLVRLDGYQWLNDEWRHVYYVEYTYNDQGLIATRTNYNKFDSWYLGGVYSYTYNADGQIIQSDLDMDGIVYTRVQYAYEDGKLKRETWLSCDFSSVEGDLIPYEVIDYNYRNGLLQLADHTAYDQNGQSEWNGSESYQYDDNGNCVEYQQRNANDQVIERRVYRFDERLVSDTWIPWHPEILRPYLYSNRNLYFKEEFYTVDVENVLRYFCDYDYDYINHVGIEEQHSEDMSACYPNPTQGAIMVSAPAGQRISVYDMVGRCVLDMVSTGIQQVELPQKGLYVVRVGNVSRKVVCR